METYEWSAHGARGAWRPLIILLGCLLMLGISKMTGQSYKTEAAAKEAVQAYLQDAERDMRIVQADNGLDEQRQQQLMNYRYFSVFLAELEARHSVEAAFGQLKTTFPQGDGGKSERMEKARAKLVELVTVKPE